MRIDHAAKRGGMCKDAIADIDADVTDAIRFTISSSEKQKITKLQFIEFYSLHFSRLRLCSATE